MGNYYLDNINLRTTYGIEVQKSTGLFDIPKRKDPVAYSWPDENGEQAFLDTDDIVFEPRDIVLQCFIKADSEAAFHNKYNKFWGDFMTASTETNKLHYLRHPYSPYIYECYIKDGTVFNRMTKYNSNKAVGTFYITLREPVPILPCDQKVITLNGTNQSASIASSMTPLQMNTEDFIITGWFRTSANYTADSGWIVCKTGTGIWGIYIAQTTNKLTMYLSDGTNVASAVSPLAYNDGNIHFFALVADQGSATGLMMFIDNTYIGAASLASIGDLADTTAFAIGKRGANNDGYFSGDIDEVRVFRFGTGGLYITGTFGTSGIIRVGDSTGDLIWADSASLKDTCLLNMLYKWPFTTLNKLGFPSIDNANRTELVSNGGFDSDTGWIKLVTWQITGGVATVTGTSSAQDIYQSLGSNTCKLNKYYVLSYEITANTLTGNSTSAMYLFRGTNRPFIGTTLTLTTSIGVYNIVLQGSGETTQILNFRLRDVVTGGSISLDNVSLKEIGEVARWKFDDTVTDENVNDQDLTANNTPTYSVR